MTLNARQRAFCVAYVKLRNGAAAAREAGYSERAAKEQAARLLTNAHVRDEIDRLGREWAKEQGIDYAWMLEKLTQVVEQALRGEPIRNSKGEETGEWRFDASGANRAIELIGKHIGFFAPERMPVDNPAPGRPGENGNLMTSDELEQAREARRRLEAM